MRRFRSSFVVVLIGCVIAGGCQSTSLPGVVVEQRPCAAPNEIKAGDSGVFVLWRWVPVVPVAAEDASTPAKPAADRAVEICEVYAAQGSPVGFRRRAGGLLAIGGTTAVPLDEAHYSWTSQSLANLQTNGPRDTADFMMQWWFWTSQPAFFWIYCMGLAHPAN